MEVPSLYFLIFELEYIIEGKKKKKRQLENPSLHCKVAKVPVALLLMFSPYV